MSTVFVGGWATSEEQFPQLAESSKFLVPFSGYRPAELPELIAEGGSLLIGWSTGAHMLLRDCSHLFSLYDHVLLIAPFLSFTDSFPERLVRRMISGLQKSPRDVVDAFHKNCGEAASLSFDEDNTATLIEGLEFLIESKIETVSESAADNLILVHGDDDKIVRRSAFEPVSQIVPAAEVRFIDGGHKISESVLLNIIEGL